MKGTKYQYYHVKEYNNGCIISEPRELSVPDTISEKVIEDMDKAISGYRMIAMSPTVD